MSDRQNAVGDADVVARLNDPRNDPRSSSFDRGFATETDRLSQGAWGETSGSAPQAVGTPQPTRMGQPSDDALQARLSDPRYDPRHRSFDASFAAETDRLFQTIFQSAGPEAAQRTVDAAPTPRAPSTTSDTDLRARISDTRYDPRSQTFDPAFAEETDRLSKELWGGGEQEPFPVANQQPEIASQVPAEISGYRLAESEALAPYVQALEGDDLYRSAREIAREAGLTQQQFSAFVTPMLERLHQAGAEDEPVDYAAERAKLVPENARHLDMSAQHAAASARVETALRLVETDAVTEGLDREAAAFVVAQLGDSALGVRALEFFMGRARSPWRDLGV